jgi:hypothetical protein
MPMRLCRIGFFKVLRADAAQMQKWPVRMNWPFLCRYVDETGETRSAGDETGCVGLLRCAGVDDLIA